MTTPVGRSHQTDVYGNLQATNTKGQQLNTSMLGPTIPISTLNLENLPIGSITDMIRNAINGVTHYHLILESNGDYVLHTMHDISNDSDRLKEFNQKMQAGQIGIAHAPNRSGATIAYGHNQRRPARAPRFRGTGQNVAAAQLLNRQQQQGKVITLVMTQAQSQNLNTQFTQKIAELHGANDRKPQKEVADPASFAIKTQVIEPVKKQYTETRSEKKQVTARQQTVEVPNTTTENNGPSAAKTRRKQDAKQNELNYQTLMKQVLAQIVNR